MKKVYLVTSGEYSDYRVDAVFSSKELAQKFIDSFKKEEKYSYGGFNDILEMDIDPSELEIREGLRPYCVTISKEGAISELEIPTFCGDLFNGFNPQDLTKWNFNWKNNYTTYMFARDGAHAVKIANDRRIQIIALNKWPVKE